MARWQTLETEAPEIARGGRALLYQYGPGLAYLATVRSGHGLRIHPFCPVVTDGGIYGRIIDSPKRQDLLRDGRFALHAFSPEDRRQFMLPARPRIETAATIPRCAKRPRCRSDMTVKVDLRVDDDRALRSPKPAGRAPVAAAY